MLHIEAEQLPVVDIYMTYTLSHTDRADNSINLSLISLLRTAHLRNIGEIFQ